MCGKGEGGPCACAQFQREVVAMALLPDHPHVLRLLGACMRPPLLALVTPFCPKCVWRAAPLATASHSVHPALHRALCGQACDNAPTRRWRAPF